jgi:hypothetical protein
MGAAKPETKNEHKKRKEQIIVDTTGLRQK